MLQCGGLDILTTLFFEDPKIHVDAMHSLNILASFPLKIKSPEKNNVKQHHIIKYKLNRYEVPENCSNVVCFKFEDGVCVDVDRDFLGDKSDYFNRLLLGNFRESRQKEIVLQDVRGETFSCLLSLLSDNMPAKELMDFSLDLDTMLELIELTERYLLVELNVFLTECVEAQYMTKGNVPSIYLWSIESGTNILRVESVAFAIVGTISDRERLKMFEKFLALGYSKQFVGDLKNLLAQFLR